MDDQVHDRIVDDIVADLTSRKELGEAWKAMTLPTRIYIQQMWRDIVRRHLLTKQPVEGRTATFGGCKKYSCQKIQCEFDGCNHYRPPSA